MGKIETEVKGCARCNEDHEGMTFNSFTNPMVWDEHETVGGPFRYTHWALCPRSGEPIILRVE